MWLYQKAVTVKITVWEVELRSPINTGRFIMFSMITNIYNKKNKRPSLVELFTATGKLKKFFFWQIEMFDIDTSIRYSSCSAVNGLPLDLCLHRHPISVNCLYHPRMILSVGGSFAYFAWNARCTVITDLLVWYSNTQNDFSPGAAIFSLHTLASPSGRNVNYDEKQLMGKQFLSYSFYLYRFRKYVSYGFTIINFCNPGAHYETPCIYESFEVIYLLCVAVWSKVGRSILRIGGTWLTNWTPSQYVRE